MSAAGDLKYVDAHAVETSMGYFVSAARAALGNPSGIIYGAVEHGETSVRWALTFLPHRIVKDSPAEAIAALVAEVNGTK